LVQTFPGGLAFRVRIDQKIIPAATVKAEVEKRVEAAKVHTGRKPGKALRAEMKHEVMDELCRRALVKTVASITCFYDIANGYLIVPTSSKKIADVCTSLLVHAVGSVKTETINVSNVKHGLTTRMLRWLDDDAEAFGAFAPCDEAALAAEGRKVAVKMLSLQQARDGLKEALRDGLHVTSIGLHFDGIDFRLTSDFTLKGIAFADPSVPEEEEDLWAADAAIQAGKVSAVINELTAMLSYQDAATEGGAA
jgi:recombination associated protein RdgC